MVNYVYRRVRIVAVVIRKQSSTQKTWYSEQEIVRLNLSSRVTWLTFWR